MYFTALRCTALHGTALRRIAQHCTEVFQKSLLEYQANVGDVGFREGAPDARCGVRFDEFFLGKGFPLSHT